MNVNRVTAFTQRIHSQPSISSTLSTTWSQLLPTLTRLFTLPSSASFDVESGSEEDYRMSDTDHQHPSQSEMNHGSDDIKGWLTPEIFMSLYTQVFEYCASEPVEFTVDNQMVDREYILYSKLYTFLNETLSSWCSSIMASSNNNQSSQQHNLFEFTVAFLAASDRFREAIKHVEAVFLYLERHWYEKAILDAPNDKLLPVLKIMELGRRVWEDAFLLPLKPLVFNALASLIEMERVTSNHNDNTITRLVQAYKLSTPTLQIKAKHNTLKVNAIEAFYRDNVASYCQNVVVPNDDTEFVNELSSIWGREVGMAERHLGSSILVKAALKTHLLDRHLDRLLDLFRENVVNDGSLIRNIYELMKQRKSLMEELEKALEQAIITRGSSLQTVIDFINEYTHCTNLLTLLESHPEAIKARDRAFRVTLNRPDNRKKFPELLAHFFDRMLQDEDTLTPSHVGDSSGRSTPPLHPLDVMHDFSDRLDLVVALFRLIEEKDVFQRAYIRFMTKRLVFNGTPFNRPSEEAVILKLRDICGPGYVSPLARILTDSDISHQLTRQFCNTRRVGECSFQVLAHGSWPAMSMTQSPPSQMPRIPHIQPILDEFVVSYTTVHQGRKLQWIPELGTADVQIEVGGTGKRYILTVLHTHTMLIYSSPLGYNESVGCAFLFQWYNSREHGHPAETIRPSRFNPETDLGFPHTSQTLHLPSP